VSSIVLIQGSEETDVEVLEREGSTEDNDFPQYSARTQQPRSFSNNGDNVYVIPMPQTDP